MLPPPPMRHPLAPCLLGAVLVVAVLCLLGCFRASPALPRGGEIRLPGGTVIRQPENAEAPATARITYVYDPLSDPAFKRVSAALAARAKGLQPVGPATVEEAPIPAMQGTLIELSTGQPAVTDTTKIETTKAELASRQPLLYIGSACILAGLLIATLLKYPTPGGMTALAGGALIGAHTYPWLGAAAAALLAAAAAMYIGHEIGERKTSATTTP